jgi:hypothetical protein
MLSAHRWYGFVAEDAKKRSAAAPTVDKTVEKAVETTSDQ